jgi:type II secretory pathway pseudopilin PulG
MDRSPITSARVMFYLLGILAFIVMMIPAWWIVTLIPDPPRVTGRLNSQTAFVLFARVALALVVSAILLYAGLTDRESRQGGKGRQWVALLTLALSGLLLVKALHSLYWLLIWDSTYDPLDVLCLPIPILGALLAGAFLATGLPRQLKRAGVVYTLLLLVLVTGVFAASQQVDFRRLTAARAQQVARALDSYYERHGRYPETLRQLTPWTTLSVYEPVIIYGQPWCYDGGDDYYRLGYVDREHWSDPRLIGRIAYSAGNAPADSPLCAAEAAALLKRSGGYPYSYWKDKGP